jgi:thiamine-monophosphate kinase
MPDTIASIGEQALVERVRARAGVGGAAVHIGIGDDAAVLEPVRGMLEVITTDGLVEGVHFRRDWTAPGAIGHKALAVNLSDLAAMGAVPRACLLSLAMPESFPLTEFDELIDGFLTLAAAEGAALIGGNLTRSPGPLMIDVTAIGAAGRRRLLRRNTASAGDELYVTGSLGAAAAGLAILASGASRDGLDVTSLECVRRYERPDARTRCGRVVGRSRAAAAAIDLSDGLADAARRLARDSGLGVVVEASALPLHEGARQWAERRGVDCVGFVLSGGEDYELAFGVRPRHRNRFLGAIRRTGGLPVTRVGRFTREAGEWLEQDGRRVPLVDGFTHFSPTQAVIPGASRL